jgi:hypothetical protein
MAVNLQNHLPREVGSSSPIQKFSTLDVKDTQFPKKAHPFGCPVYVLDAALQSGKGKSKWTERSRLGVYLGYSPEHASSVALVLNLQTGHVSPQFHVVFDDRFDTVAEDANFETLWQEKAGLPNSMSDQDLEGHVIPPGTNGLWFTTPGQAVQVAQRTTAPRPQPVAVPEGGPTTTVVPEGAPQGAPQLPPVPAPAPTQMREAETLGSIGATDTAPRRSARLASQPPKSYAMLAFLDMCSYIARVENHQMLPDGTCNGTQTLSAFASSAAVGDPDTMHLKDAKKQEDWPQFCRAMELEVEDFNH